MSFAAAVTLFLKVLQIRLTQSASDGEQVKLEVVSRLRGQCAKQVASEFAPAGTAQSTSVPDFADGVAALIAMLNQVTESDSEGLIRPQLLFQTGHASCRQPFVQPRRQFLIGPDGII